jgi:hypothetical protein
VSSTLRLPAILSVALLSAAGTALIAGSCGGDDGGPDIDARQADAREPDAEPDADPSDCMGFYCIPETPEDSCPKCADEVPSCPSGCILT